jgi:hypothetical protein
MGWTALLVFETFAVCPPALWLVSRSFARGWSDSFAGAARRRTDPLAGVGARHSSIVALATKDLLTFLRTPQLWFNHIGALMFVVYLLVGHAVQTPILPLTVQLAMVQIGFVAVLGAVTPGMTSLSLEHAAIWLLKSSPLRARDVLVAKVLVPFGQTGTIVAIGGGLLSAGYGFTLPQSFAVVAFDQPRRRIRHAPSVVQLGESEFDQSRTADGHTVSQRSRHALGVRLRAMGKPVGCAWSARDIARACRKRVARRRRDLGDARTGQPQSDGARSVAGYRPRTFQPCDNPFQPPTSS